jgi:hypothetical protein
MHRILSLGLLGAAAGAAFVSATIVNGRQTPAAPTPGASTLNPSIVADRQMLAFGRENPDCPRWTNWEKLCSRTGPAGSINCNIDPGRRVAPSMPFCTVMGANLPRERSEAERTSMDRFCRYETVRAPSGEGRRSSRRECARQDPERPFNGRRLGSLLNSACGAWRDYETYRLVCTTGGNRTPSVPDCAVLAASHYEHPRLLVCSQWTGPSDCDGIPVMSRNREAESVIIGADPNIARVHGLFCSNR